MPRGVAHSFLAITDATVSYACSTEHDPVTERTIDALDAHLALPWPPITALIRSTRDREASSWSRAISDGWLPVAHQEAQW